jgi:nucleoside 2-deoxyribosyltransferase
MARYFEHIDGAELVVFVNEKNGKEHYGIGTMIELGYAFASGKELSFTKEPTNANILSLLVLAQSIVR